MKPGDIKVSNVAAVYVAQLDKNAAELSKKLGKKISRNEYVKMLIQDDCELGLMKLKEDRFDHAVSNLTASMSNQESKFQEYIDSNNRLFHLMASGIDISEGVEKL